jgi:hypothetical protein
MRRSLRLGLLGKFALASIVPIVLLALVLSQYLRHRIEQRAFEQAERAAVLVARVGFQPQIRPADLRRGYLPASRQKALDRALQSKRQEDGVARIKIWNKGVTVVYSDKRSLIGKKFHIFGPLRRALAGDVHSQVSAERRADTASERHLGKLLEVYVPLLDRRGRPGGAADIFLDYEPIAEERHLVGPAGDEGTGRAIRAIAEMLRGLEYPFPSPGGDVWSAVEYARDRGVRHPSGLCHGIDSDHI